MTDRVDRYFEFIRKQLLSVDDISADALKIHRKILYVAFVDSLSGLVYPAQSQNRARFTEFVTQFGGWSHGGKVSTPHLARALRLNPDPAYDPVRKLVRETLQGWQTGKLIQLSEDLEAGVVGTHWPSGKQFEQPVDGSPWHHLKHVELLYAYRNALVHSFRSLGGDPEMPEDRDPYYLSTQYVTEGDADNGAFHWELIYPTAFLRELAITSLNSVEAHIRANEIDPIEVLRGGRFWLKALN